MIGYNFYSTKFSLLFNTKKDSYYTNPLNVKTFIPRLS